MAFTLVEIAGTFAQASSKPGGGKVTATLSKPIENSNKTLQVAPIKAPIQNGKVVLKLYANNDPETLPQNSFYTFLVEPAQADSYTFKTIVPHNAVGGKIDLSELYVNSGLLSLPTQNRPLLTSKSSTQVIGETLAALGLVEFQNVNEPGVIP